MILFISGGEIIFILLAAVLIFGAKRLPEIARILGKGMKQFKDAANDIKKEMTDDKNDFNNEFKDIKKSADDIKKNVEKYKIFEDNNKEQ